MTGWNTATCWAMLAASLAVPGLPLALIAGLRMSRPEHCQWGRIVFDPVYSTEPCMSAPRHSLLVFDRDDLLHLCPEHREVARRMFEEYPGLD